MVFLVPDVYNQIKEKGRREGRIKGREEGRKEGRAIGERMARERILAITREAMRDAGIDDETRRRLEDALARRDEL